MSAATGEQKQQQQWQQLVGDLTPDQHHKLNPSAILVEILTSNCLTWHHDCNGTCQQLLLCNSYRSSEATSEYMIKARKPCGLRDTARVHCIVPCAFVSLSFLANTTSSWRRMLQSKNKLKDSLVVDNTRGTYMKSDVCTSSGAQFGRGYDDVLRKIEARVASITMIPIGALQ